MNLSTSTSNKARGSETSRAAGVEERLVGRVLRAQSAVASPGCRGRTQPRRSSNPAPAGAGATAEAGRFPPFVRVGRALDVAISNPRIPAPGDPCQPGACTRRGSEPRGAAKQQRSGGERPAGDVAAHRQSGAGRRARAQSPAKPRASRGEWQTTHGQESPSHFGTTPVSHSVAPKEQPLPFAGGGGLSPRSGRGSRPSGRASARALPRGPRPEPTRQKRAQPRRPALTRAARSLGAEPGIAARGRETS